VIVRGIFFGLLGGISLLGILACADEYSVLVAKCKTIQLGDTEDHVIKLMGPPERTHTYEFKGQKSKTLWYPAPPLESTIPQVKVNAETLVVESIHCEEGHSVVKKGNAEEK